MKNEGTITKNGSTETPKSLVGIGAQESEYELDQENN